MASAAPRGALRHLRQALATLDKDKGFSLAEEEMLPLGLPAVDAALGGGLACAALHELAPAAPAQFGTAAGFALAIAALRTAGGRSALFIQTDFAALEAGAPYGPGLDGFGLPMQRLIMLRVPRPVDALWACEEALKSHGVAVVIAELPEAGEAADFTATRRLTLAARAGGGLGLLLRHRAAADRHRGHHPLAGRRRAEHARPFRRARTHRLRSFAEPEPARPQRPLHCELGSPCVRLPPANAISRCGCGG